MDKGSGPCPEEKIAQGPALMNISKEDPPGRLVVVVTSNSDMYELEKRV
jgi:hypothetical protein